MSPIRCAIALIPLLALVGAARADSITALCYTPDGRSLLAASEDGQIYIYIARLQKERRRLPAHKDGVYALSLSADGKLLASGGADQKVRLWNIADITEVKEIRAIDVGDKIYAVALSPDGKLLAAGGDGKTIHIWDTTTGQLRHTLKEHASLVTALAFAPDGKLLASGGEVINNANRRINGVSVGDQLRLWDPVAGKLIRRLPQAGQSLVFGADGRVLVSAGLFIEQRLVGNRFRPYGSSRINFWDIARSRPQPILDDYSYGLTRSHDGKFLAASWGAARLGGTYVSAELNQIGIHVWEMSTHLEMRKLKVPKETEALVVALSPDGNTIAAGGENNGLKFHDLAPPGWNVATAGQVRDASLKEHWDNLAGSNGPAIWEAIWRLSAAGDRGVMLFQPQLKPVAPLGERSRRLINDLDSDEFQVRETASHELRRLGAAIEIDLKQGMEQRTSLEFRRRAEVLLNAMQQYPGTADERRFARAIVVLERIGSPAARELLRTLARGAPHAWPTREAQAALQRLEKRFKPMSDARP